MPAESAIVKRWFKPLLEILVQPFEQSLGTSVKSLGSVITISALTHMLFSSVSQVNYRDSGNFALLSLLLVTVAVIISVIFAKHDKLTAVARTISVSVFWIAACSVVVVLMGTLFTDPFDISLRRFGATVILLPLSAVYLWRNLDGSRARAIGILLLWLGLIILIFATPV